MGSFCTNAKMLSRKPLHILNGAGVFPDVTSETTPTCIYNYTHTLAVGRWFPPGAPVSSTRENDINQRSEKA